MGGAEKKVNERLAPEEVEYRALTLQAVGALLLAFDAIPAVFVFVGIRDGSLLWLYWTAVEGLIGMGLVAAGLKLRERATELLARSVKPHSYAGDAEHREAA